MATSQQVYERREVISFYAEAQYSGNEQTLRRKGVYSIEIWQDWRGRYVVGVTHGYERRLLQGYIYKYRTLRELLASWHCIKPESFYRFSEK